MEYSDVDTKSTVQPTFGAPIESHQTVTRTVTRTNIILRYFF
ncbi:MAG TPA: hypothetical protein VFV10_04820 [Gammaproteobacteria bacterium]|nr:hypothetical protein [Gammaproteobacteria bacterium]